MLIVAELFTNVSGELRNCISIEICKRVKEPRTEFVNVSRNPQGSANVDSECVIGFVNV